MDWIVQTFFSSLWGWLGVTGIIVAICGVIAWFVQPLRKAAIGVAIVALTITSAYFKGNRDRARLEARRKEEAVAKARKAYDEIDRRPDTPDTVSKRLRDGSF